MLFYKALREFVPINFFDPPPGAVVAVEASLRMLAEADSHFRGLKMRLCAHPVLFSGLEDVVQVTSPERWLANLDDSNTWRFFVTSPTMKIGVVEVRRHNNGELFEFLAFREGTPIESAARSLQTASTWAANKPHYYVLLIRVPGLSTDLYWLLPTPGNTNDIKEQWILPIDTQLPKLEGTEVFSISDCYYIVRSESLDVLKTAFAQTLKGGFGELPPLGGATI